MKKLLSGRRDLELLLFALIVVSVTTVVLAAITSAGDVIRMGVPATIALLAGALAGAARGSNPQPPPDPPKQV